MKKTILIFALLIFGSVFQSCELEEIENPNAPTVGSFENGATLDDLKLLASGLEAGLRIDLGFHYETISILGREYNDLTGVDPRYTGELLKGPLDNNGFLTTRSYAAWYNSVNAANILLTAVENSAAGLSDNEKNSFLGYARTLKAYCLLMVANRQFTNGIRVDVADPDNLGPFLSYNDALGAIMDLLNQANTELNSASDDFLFDISDGFLSFNVPSSFAEFNRALASRVALYQGDNTMALNLLNASFLDLNGDLFNGAAHIFGTTGNDIQNTQFKVPDLSGQEFMINNSWINDAEAGDLRVVEKSNLLDETVNFDGLTGDYQIAVYDSNISPVYMIRNEELILIYAEVNIGTNNTEALNAINIIREAAGLSDYSGGQDDTSLLEEVLNQRRYSLFAEGHRWIDLRRLNRLTPEYAPIDRDGDNLIDAFPTPFSENQ